MFKLKLVPWDALHCLKKVTWTSLEGEHEGVLIDLKNEANHPGGQVIANLSKPNLHTHFGIEYAIPFLVSHDEWDWQPDQFVAIALRCIEEPSARESLGEWRA